MLTAAAIALGDTSLEFGTACNLFCLAASNTFCLWRMVWENSLAIIDVDRLVLMRDWISGFLRIEFTVGLREGTIARQSLTRFLKPVE